MINISHLLGGTYHEKTKRKIYRYPGRDRGAAVGGGQLVFHHVQRLAVAPVDLSTYEFVPQDLPMIISTLLFVLYVLYLAALILGAAIASKRRQETANTTRRLNPKLGLLGFAGFLGFLGFWTYGAFRDITPFIFFAFFGFFGFFYEGKLSNTLMDEWYVENKLRAELTAHRVMRAIVFLTLILFGRGALLGSLEYTLIAVLIVLSLTVALDLFLSEYLLYRYDHSDQLDGGGEE